MNSAKSTFYSIRKNSKSTMHYTDNEQQNINNITMTARIIRQLPPRLFTMMKINDIEYKVFKAEDGRVFLYAAPFYDWEQTHEAGCRCTVCTKIRATTFAPQLGIRTNYSKWQPKSNKRSQPRPPRTVAPKDTIRTSQRNSQPPSNSRQSSAPPEDTPYSPPYIGSPEPGEILNNNWNTPAPSWSEQIEDQNDDWLLPEITRELEPTPKRTIEFYKEKNKNIFDRIHLLDPNYGDIIPTLPNYLLAWTFNQHRENYNRLSRAEEILIEIKDKKLSPSQAHRDWKLYMRKCEHGVRHFHASVECWSCNLVETMLDERNKATF